jgi:dienelactone hydrolase
MLLLSRFFLATISLFLLISSLPAAPLSASPALSNSAAAALLHDFFLEPDAAARAALAAKFAPLAPKSCNDLRALLHRAATFPDLQPGSQTFQTKPDGPVPAINYTLRVPPNYKSSAGRPWPLIVACHPLGGSGQAFVAFVENLLGPDVDNFLIACPDAPDHGVFTPTRINAEYPRLVLEDVRHRANLDSNRSILMGYSKGGYTTWYAALFDPGDWAAAIPMAACPLSQAQTPGMTLYLPNVLDLALQLHWGALDSLEGQSEGTNTYNREVAAEMKRLGAKKFEGLEYPGQGHDLTLQTAKIRAFALAARRQPFPDQGHLIFHALWQGRAWSVRALAAAHEDFDFSKNISVSINSKEDLLQAVKAYYLKADFDLQVRLRSVDNTFVVLSKDLQELEIELPADRLDWSRPVQVLVNTKSIFAGRRAVDYPELLETARRSYDLDRLVAARLHWSATP